MAELDRRELELSSRNLKTHSIKTFFAFLRQAGRGRLSSSEFWKKAGFVG
jgi:hypothetical protein